MPLELNWAQIRLWKVAQEQRRQGLPVRIVALKARQLGISTVIGGLFYFDVSQHSGQRAMVITHHSDATKTLFDMTQRYHSKCPILLKPHTKYSSRRELQFDRLDSSYTVATAGGDAVGRSETLTHLHASEVSFWPSTTAKDIWAGLDQTVAEESNTMIIIESTAFGMSGLFYEQWRAAIDGESGYYPLFLPWYEHPEYRTTLPDGKNLRLLKEEKELKREYKLDFDQLLWRRRKIARSSPDTFCQEYPSDSEEAFLTSGSPVFDLKVLIKMRDEAKPFLFERIPMRTADEITDEESIEWTDQERGHLKIYKEIKDGDDYFIGADVGGGFSDGDYSCAQILNRLGELCATYRARVQPDFFADILDSLGKLWNDAFICCENNNHGILTCNRLSKDLSYVNFYTEIRVDKLTDEETVKLGFTTTQKSKVLVINQLRGDLRDGNVTEIDDKPTLSEMLSFVVTDSGKLEGDAGAFDDTVIALALANYVNDGPVIKAIDQSEYYVEAI